MNVQNKYVGDLGDFGKFGVLRYLCYVGEPSSFVPSLGVIWYLVPDEVRLRDGRFTSYLYLTPKNQERFRDCDPCLYDALQGIVDSGTRSVASIRRSDILPRTSLFCEDVLTFDGLSGGGRRIREERVARRAQWFESALRATESCDMVFLDPDNGLEVRVGRHQLRGPKYAYYDELIPFALRDQSLVIYHHVARRGSAQDQIRDRLAQLKNRLHREAFALLYHRGSARAFFVVPTQRHWEGLSQRANAFLETRWSEHFEMVVLA